MLRLIIALVMVGYLNALEIKSISANFTQIVKNESQNIEYKGKLIATVDSKGYWEYYTPVKKQIIINKDRVVIYERELNQAIVDSKLSIDFLKVINSIKKSKNNLYESIINNQKFLVSMKDNKPSKIEYMDDLDNEIVILLSNVKIDEKIDESIFDLKLPEDADIITN